MTGKFWPVLGTLSLLVGQQYDIQCRCDTTALTCSCAMQPVVISSPQPPQPPISQDQGVTTDTSPKQVPRIPRPAPGQVIVDPTFGTKILRVTDDTLDSWKHLHSFNHVSLPRADGKRWLIYYGGAMEGYVAEFDPTQLRIVKVWKQFGPAPNSTRPLHPFPWVWSTKNPDKAWGVSGLHIFYWDFSSGTYTIAANLSGMLPSDVSYLVLRSMSSDEKRFVLQTQDIKWSYNGMAIYDMTQKKVVYFQRSAGVKPNGDGSGKWVVTVTPEQIIEVDTGSVRPYPDNFVWHFSFGNEMAYGPDGRHDLRKFHLPSLASWPLLTQPVVNWTQGIHTSITLNEQWLCVSHFTTQENDPVNWFRDEIFFVATDGSKTLKRLAHHHSNWIVSKEYYHMPRAAVSYDGKFVVFTSNWGDARRSDVYIIAVP